MSFSLSGITNNDSITNPTKVSGPLSTKLNLKVKTTSLAHTTQAQRTNATSVASGAAVSNMSDQVKFVKPLATSKEYEPSVIATIEIDKDRR